MLAIRPCAILSVSWRRAIEVVGCMMIARRGFGVVVPEQSVLRARLGWGFGNFDLPDSAHSCCGCGAFRRIPRCPCRLSGSVKPD